MRRNENRLLRRRWMTLTTAAVVHLALLPTVPAQASAAITRTAPFDAYHERTTDRGARIQACSADIQGALSARIEADPPNGSRRDTAGYCYVGVQAAKIHSNGRESITASVTFHIERAFVERPSGTWGEAFVEPCIYVFNQKKGKGGGGCLNDGDNNRIDTPCCGPSYVPTGGSAEVTEATWTHSEYVQAYCCLEAGTYDVVAYLAVGALTYGEGVLPVVAEIDATVRFISVEYGLPSP